MPLNSIWIISISWHAFAIVSPCPHSPPKGHPRAIELKAIDGTLPVPGRTGGETLIRSYQEQHAEAKKDTREFLLKNCLRLLAIEFIRIQSKKPCIRWGILKFP